jgi:hypothetical protein
LPKTLIDGGSSLNIIFTETLRKMDFYFYKMIASDEPFYGVVPGKAAYLLTVKFRQPSHEFTFGVGRCFVPYPLVLTPLV